MKTIANNNERGGIFLNDPYGGRGARPTLTPIMTVATPPPVRGD